MLLFNNKCDMNKEVAREEQPNVRAKCSRMSARGATECQHEVQLIVTDVSSHHIRWRFLCSITEMMHGNIEFICFIQ